MHGWSRCASSDDVGSDIRQQRSWRRATFRPMTQRTRHGARRAVLGALAVFTMIGVAGCGGDDDAESGSTEVAATDSGEAGDASDSASDDGDGGDGGAGNGDGDGDGNEIDGAADSAATTSRSRIPTG